LLKEFSIVAGGQSRPPALSICLIRGLHRYLHFFFEAFTGTILTLTLSPSTSNTK
jgi:hypothetical protein